jgi:hypothetical protein
VVSANNSTVEVAKDNKGKDFHNPVMIHSARYPIRAERKTWKKAKLDTAERLLVGLDAVPPLTVVVGIVVRDLGAPDVPLQY